jgi:peptide/nickel transport system ATP-binding protein
MSDIVTEQTTVAGNSRFRGSSDDVVLEVSDLTVSFDTDDGQVDAVRGLSYRVRRGEALGIVGESGSGKSVSSLAVMGLLPRTASVRGSVRILGQELVGLRDRAMTGVRGKRIAMIFQDPLTSLTPVYTAGAQIVEALRAHDRRLSERAARARAVELLEIVGIPDPNRRFDAYPHELSGGMRQRVVIAIAIANNPDVIIADEPTTALDVTVQAQVLEALQVAKSETGAALILITHDLGVIAGYADRVTVMYAGRAVETGSVEDIFYRPRMPYTLGLLGSLPRMDAERPGRLTPILGTPPSLLHLPTGCPFAPRCPAARDRCTTEEPDLLAVDDAGEHRSACHFHAELVGARSEDLFGTTARDDVLPDGPVDALDLGFPEAGR